MPLSAGTRLGSYEVVEAIGAGGRTYDVDLDGQQFLIIEETAEIRETEQIIIVQNWLDEVARLAPNGN